MSKEIDPLIGRQLANFRIDGIVKPGGMAKVYYGHDVMLQRPIAIKIIEIDEQTKPATAERFLQEARVVAAWWHEHITPVYYADKQDELYYFVMEYINGLDLMELIERYGGDGELIPHADVLRIGESVGEALDYAHEQGVIHRDVKPSNILISKDGRVLLSDFGLALAIDKGSYGEIFGTPQYIAPEQAFRSDDAVAQSDLYSLAVTLYQMLTGQLPFADESISTLVWKQLNEPPPSPSSINPHLSQAVDAVLLKALAKEPTERYLTGAALMTALQTALALSTTDQSPMSLPPLPAAVAMAGNGAPSMPSLSALSVVDRIAMQLELDGRGVPAVLLAKPKKRRRRWVALVLLLLLVGLGITAVFGTNYLSNRPEATVESMPVAVLSTATETHTPSPTNTPSLTPSPQSSATPSPTPIKTATPSPTDTPSPTPTMTVEPTAVFTGPPLHLIYDRYSFYLHSPAGNRPIEFDGLAFEAVDSNGLRTDYALQGRRWGRIYAWLEPNKCARVEPVFVPTLLRPTECADYNASLEPPRDTDIIFWTPRENVQSFRVFWRGQEIGNCSIAAGFCYVQLPE